MVKELRLKLFRTSVKENFNVDQGTRTLQDGSVQSYDTVSSLLDGPVQSYDTVRYDALVHHILFSIYHWPNLLHVGTHVQFRIGQCNCKIGLHISSTERDVTFVC